MARALDYGRAVNTGVFGFSKTSAMPFLQEWEKTTQAGFKHKCTRRMVDELACQVLLHRFPHTLVGPEWGAYLGEENMKHGIRIKVSSFTRHHVNVTMCRAKANGNYMNSMLALKEAMDGGYDEALLLDAEGYVMEGSGENVFIVRDGVLYTPDLTSALDGITRNTVMSQADELGIEVVEKRITRDEVYIADEAFFTGTAAEVTPIREVDGRAIGSGTRGPITKRLQEMYFDQVHGRRDEHPEWLTLA